jgi:DNA-directed RNA polymerase subunit RPC12/RpoP
MSKKICPHCKSRRFGPSRTRNLKERFSKAVGNSPYRCADCEWRGYVKDRRALAKGIIEFILIAVFILWIAYAAYVSVQDFLQDYRSGINKTAMAKPKPKPPQAQ